MSGGRTAPLASLFGIAGALETAGGTLLLIGLFTRPVAFLLSGEMAVAYFTGHAGQGFWPVLNGGVPAILFAFVWIYISAVGQALGASMLLDPIGPVPLQLPLLRGEVAPARDGLAGQT
jgi:uncharacterized membrane protein YphA (DoxX/SURF4 family)